MRFLRVFFLLFFSLSWNEILYSKTKLPEILLAWDNAPLRFDPRYITDLYGQYHEDLVHGALISCGPNGELVGYLATQWQWFDPTTLDVYVNPKACFSDGSLVKLEDIIATYQFFKSSPKIPTPRAMAFENILSMEKTPQNFGVRFKLKEPDTSFLTNLVVGILPKAQAESPEPLDVQTILGCGAFRVSSVENHIIRYEPNTHYGLGPQPSVKVSFKIIKDPGTRYAALVSGSIDGLQNSLLLEKLPQLEQSKKWEVKTRPSLKTTYLGFQTQDPHLSNPRTRQALSMAINREAIIQHIYQKYAILSETMLLPEDPMFSPDARQPAYDPKKASHLLDELGFKEKTPGQGRFQLTLKVGQDPTILAMARAIANDLEKVGVKTKVSSLEWGKLSQDLEKGEIQLWIMTWVGFKHPDIYRYALGSKAIPPHGANRGRFSNPTLDALLLKARGETVWEKQKNLYTEAQKLVSQELPYFFLIHPKNYSVMSKKIKGFTLYADGRFSSLRTAKKIL